MANEPIKRAPSKTRARSISRALLKRSAELGKPSAMSHGINSLVFNAPDIADEMALIFASHPNLDPIADRRLVELAAINHVQHRRAVIELLARGHNPTLERYESNLGARLERSLQAIHERDRQRARDVEKQAKTLGLAKYKDVTPHE